MTTMTRDQLIDAFLDLQDRIAAAETAGDHHQADQLMRDALHLAGEIRALRLQETSGA